MQEAAEAVATLDPLGSDVGWGASVGRSATPLRAVLHRARQPTRVHLAGCTPNPSGAWVLQQARNLSFTNLLERKRFLIHDRDSKFTSAFDELFCREGSRSSTRRCERRRRTPTLSDSSAPSAMSVSTGSLSSAADISNMSYGSTSSTTTTSAPTVDSRLLSSNPRN
jgi:hypothetical protein